jgi:uncharacterized metal-binding protein
MIYFPYFSMMLGQIPDPPQPAPEPAGDPVAQTTPKPITDSQDPQLVPIEDLRKVRHEAELNRKKLQSSEAELQALKAQISKDLEDKKFAEMSEIDRLKAQTKALEDQVNTEKTARELETKRSKLINLAAAADVPLPDFVVNQIGIEKLKSLDLTNEDEFKLAIQDVIRKAEEAGMPIVRKREGKPITPSPQIGATNPAEGPYPRPVLTTDQQITKLHSDYLKAVAEGDILKWQSIETKIRDLNIQMGGIIATKPSE